MQVDHYKVLGLSRSASAEEIKAAYRSLVKTCHPDVAGNGPEEAARWLAIAEAYETFTDPVKKADYDLYGRTDPAALENAARNLCNSHLTKAFFDASHNPQANPIVQAKAKLIEEKTAHWNTIAPNTANLQRLQATLPRLTIRKPDGTFSLDHFVSEKVQAQIIDLKRAIKNAQELMNTYDRAIGLLGEYHYTMPNQATSNRGPQTTGSLGSISFGQPRG